LVGVEFHLAEESAAGGVSAEHEQVEESAGEVDAEAGEVEREGDECGGFLGGVVEVFVEKVAFVDDAP
jgi:hypothetical protein